MQLTEEQIMLLKSICFDFTIRKIRNDYVLFWLPLKESITENIFENFLASIDFPDLSHQIISFKFKSSFNTEVDTFVNYANSLKEGHYFCSPCNVGRSFDFESSASIPDQLESSCPICNGSISKI